MTSAQNGRKRLYIPNRVAGPWSTGSTPTFEVYEATVSACGWSADIAVNEQTQEPDHDD